MAKWTEEEEARLASLYLKVPLEILVKEFPRHSLAAILSKGNKLVYGNERRWSPYEIDILVNEYGRLSNKKIRSLYLHHRSIDAIKKKARLLGLTEKKTEVVYNESFFDVWSAELAYALGLLLTDGTIKVYKSRGEFSISWCLHVDDAVPLIILHQLVGGTLSERGNCLMLSLYGRWLIEKLEALGVDIRKKSEREYFPHVPQEFLWHFIRGLVDGDGWIFLSQRDKYFRVGFCGRRWAVEWVASVWKSSVHLRNDNRGYRDVFYTEVFQDEALRVCKEMYESCGLLYIPRKRNVYQEFTKSAVRRDYPSEGE